MENIEDPIRVSQPSPYQGRWPEIADAVKLPSPRGVDRSFLTVLLNRRSASHFNEASIDDLSSWLYFSASCQGIGVSDPNRKRGFAPSFGGLQSTRLLLGLPDGTWTLYLPSSHSLASLKSPEAGAKLRSLAMGIVEAPNACVIALVSDTSLAENYYYHPVSLQLRDAGVLLGHGALVAAAFGLQFRILGALGHPWSNMMLDDMGIKLTATGLALLGGSADLSPEPSEH